MSTKKTKKNKFFSLPSLIWLLPFAGFFVGYVLMNLFFGAEKVAVPNIVGLPIAQALKSACDQRLHIRVLSEKVDPNTSPGTVLSQRPQKGQFVKQHQTIFITLSCNPPERTMPNVLGKDSAGVYSDLQAAHVNPVCVSVPSHAPRGTVIAQFPVQGDLMKDSVSLFVAKHADERVLMPALCGRTLEQVKEFLSRHALEPLVIGADEHLPEALTVVKQRPLAGTVIDLAHLPTIQLLVQAGVEAPILQESDQVSQTSLNEAQTAP